MKNRIISNWAAKFTVYLFLFIPATLFVSFTIADSVARKETTVRLRSFLEHQLHARLVSPKKQSGEPFTQIINDTVPFKIVRADSQHIIRYFISGAFIVADENVAFFLTDSLILNYKKWALPAGNRITYSSAGISAIDFSLTSDSALIAVTNSTNIVGAPVDINLQNLDIRDIVGLFSSDPLIVSGLLNGKIVASEFERKLPLLTGTGAVQGFAIMRQVFGTLQVNAQMSDDTIHANAGLGENGNEFNVRGNLFLNRGSQQLEALLDITRLQMATLQGFMNGNMSNAAGSISGAIALKGKLLKPEWKGTINFDTTRFTLNKLGSSYTIENQKIALDYPAFSFNRFTIKDSLGNAMRISGNLCSRMQGEKKYDLQLDLSSRDFTAINALKAINNQLYGYAGIDADVSLSGNTAAPAISGFVHLNGKTDLTLVLPQKNTDNDAARSVVRFTNTKDGAIDKTRPVTPGVGTTAARDTLFKNLVLLADRQVKLTIVIDPSTGDELKVSGVGELRPGTEQGSNMSIAGNYVLDSGYYELDNAFLKKRFNVIKGSTIYFDGTPGDAQVNIRAEYIVNTSAKDLLGNEVGSISPAVAKSFDQKIPFKVILFLKGALKKPGISFDIHLPEAGSINSQLRYTLENKLVQLRSDASAINKQVFALLALGRFVGEQSTDFFKGNETDFSNISRESVSKFLSAALDQLASDLFKGINVDLNINTFKDFISSEGMQTTDLNVAVSSDFLNDRLSVTVGKNFGIEAEDGSTKASRQKASRFLPDVTFNYKLSSDGKYMLRSYNKNQFEVILDGYVVETGVGFIVTMDYDKFEELFGRKKEKQGNK